MPRLTLRIDLPASQLGPGKIRLLELIDSRGSIAAAGEQMEMSYRRAWLLVDECNKMFEAPLVEARAGGRGGANAKLTLLGRAVVQLYRGVEADALKASARRLAELEALASKAPPPEALTSPLAGGRKRRKDGGTEKNGRG